MPEPGDITATAPPDPAAQGAGSKSGRLAEEPANGDKALAGLGLERSPRFADSYGLVLVLLVIGFFVQAVAGELHYGRMISLLVLATTTWLALRASQVQRRVLRIAVALIPAVTLAAVVLSFVGSDNLSRAATAALTAMLVLVAPLAIVRRLATHPIINLNTFYGAVCVYLLIAMFFASMFALSGLLGDGSFFAQIQPPDKASAVDYLYFSFTTITTVGYGDLTAQANVGRMLAVLEAVLGQLYLITVVALVVQNLGQARRKKRPID